MLKGITKIFSNIVDRIATTRLSAGEVEKMLSDFYLQLVSADVAVETAETIVETLRRDLQEVRLSRFSDQREAIKGYLKNAVEPLIKTADVDSS